MIEHSYKIRSVLLLFVAALAMWFFFMVANRFAIRPKADANTVTVQFNPGSANVEDGNASAAQFSITTAQESGISGIDAIFAITGPVVMKQIQPLSSSLPSATFTSLTKSATRFSYATIPGDGALPSAVTIPFEIACTGPGRATIELNQDRSQFLGTAVGNIFEIEVGNTYSINCSGVGLFGNGAPATAKFEQALQNAPVGQNLTYRLLLKPDGQTGISAFNVDLKFNSEILEVVEVKEPVVVTGDSRSPTETPDDGRTTTPVPPENPDAPAPGVSCKADSDCPSVCTDPTNPLCQSVCVNNFCEIVNKSEVSTSNTSAGGCTADADCPSPCADPTLPGCQMSCVAGACQPATNTGGPGAGGATPTQPATSGRSCTTDTDCPRVCADVAETVCKNIPCVAGFCEGTNSGGGGPTPTGQPNDPSRSPFIKIKNETDPSAGTISLAYAMPGGDDVLPKAVAVDVVVKGKKNGTGKLQFATAQMTGNVDGNYYDVVTTEAEYRIGQSSSRSPGGEVKDMTLNLKLRLQGVTSKPKTTQTIPVKIGLGDGTLEETIFQTATFTADDDGVWSGAVTFSAPPGDGFKVLVKPPHHMQKRICDAVPAEKDADGNDAPGYYNCARGAITLVEGANTFDFTGAAILVGDLQVQDGIVNARDRIQCTENFGKSDAEALRVADVNYDGGVNGLDCSAILVSMTLRHDDN